MISFGKSFLFELHADVQIVLLPVKLWIAPYWRDVFLFFYDYINIYMGDVSVFNFIKRCNC